MRYGVLGSLAAVLLVAAGPDDKTITVELKDFAFKPARAELASLFSLNEGEGKLCFYTNGPAEALVKIPADGEYEIVVSASCDSAQNERAKFKLSVDGQLVDKETLLTADTQKDYKFKTKLTAGSHKVTVEFTNDVYKENEYDRNLYVHGVSLKKVK